MGFSFCFWTFSNLIYQFALLIITKYLFNKHSFVIQIKTIFLLFLFINLFLYKYIGFNWWGSSSRKTEWVSNPSLFSNIVSAIGDCGLRDSLTTINVAWCKLDKSKVQQMFNLKSMSHVNVIEDKYDGGPLTK